MVFGKVKDTMADLAETLRRAFQDPPSKGVLLDFPAPPSGTIPAPETIGRGPEYRFTVGSHFVPRFGSPALREERLAFLAALCREDAWERWATGVAVCEMPVFRAERCPRLEVPALPRAARTHAVSAEGFICRAQFRREPILPPRMRQEPVRLAVPVSRRALDLALSLPVSFVGEDIQKLPKGLWMRYTLQLVKATDQNIRNLDVLGLYRIPERGVAGLRHDAKTGRLHLSLGAEAGGAALKPFLLARRKDDRSLVSCFLEDQA